MGYEEESRNNADLREISENHADDLLGAFLESIGGLEDTPVNRRALEIGISVLLKGEKT